METINMNSINCTTIFTLPQALKIKIADEIFEKFPATKIAFSILSVPILTKKEQSKEEQNYISNLKQDTVKRFVDLGITPENYIDLSEIKAWRKVFQTFQAGEEKKSTIENLARRAASEGDKIRANKKADMGAISNFVDLYNMISLETLTPMGATNIQKISQNEHRASIVELRFAKQGESYIPLGKDTVSMPLTPESVVYADETNILTGYWNYRDAAHCSVPASNQIEYILAVADQVEEGGDAEQAILNLNRELARINGVWHTYQVLHANRRDVILNLSQIQEGIVSEIEI